jgi:acyl-coenzyme A synthetase/AMP-(fatty) acid ligase
VATAGAAGATAGPDDIRSRARTRIAAFKLPYDIRIVAELPRNATRKVMKAELRRCPAGW